VVAPHIKTAANGGTNMEFLKAILGEELYAKLEQAVNAYNGNEANKDKQVKIANLGTGEYVSKGKHASLEAENQTNATKLAEANNLIAQLQKAAKGDENLQGQVTAYQTKVQELEAELEKTKLENAIKVELLSSKALDVDYLTFKLKEKGDEITLDENGKIKGWDDKLAALKTQFPTQFETSVSKKVMENKLPNGDGAGGDVLTKEALLKKPYAERMKIFNENPEAYNNAMKN
jgi:hypothetical protein